MPRGKPRKTMEGEKALKVSSVPGQRYGEGDDQQALQSAMPTPDRSGAPTPQAVAEGRPVLPGRAPDPMMVQNYLAETTPNYFGQGTQRPDEPVTAGMRLGPGPGPRAPRASTPIARTLLQLSRETGNPRWQELAQRAGLWQ